MEIQLGFAALPSFDNWQPDILANYGGSDRKNGLIAPDGARYLVKYAKKQAPPSDLATRYVNNALCEYLTSHILTLLGYQVQETALGTLGGEVVVLCKNFSPPGGTLIEFEQFMRRHYYSYEISKAPNLNQLYEILERDPVLSPQSQLFKACYWERFVGDALVGISDRHNDNFGYIINADNSVSAAPVYDNGGALYPDLSEQDMQNVLANPKEIMRRVRLFPKAALEIQNQQVPFYDIMSSGICEELTNAVISTFPRICNSLPAVREFINSCTFISLTRKIFYNVMLAERLAFILEPAYNRCLTRQFDLTARHRLESAAAYSETDFKNYWQSAQPTAGQAAADIRDSVIANTHHTN